MSQIAKNDASGDALKGALAATQTPAAQLPREQPSAWAQLSRQVAQAQEQHGAHPTRTVLLLPFFQLQTAARSAWLASMASLQPLAGATAGFVPRIETTKSWQQRLAHFEPQEWDMCFDAGQDFLRARKMLHTAGLAAHLKVLTPLLVQAAQQLGGLAASMPPDERAQWAQRLRPVVQMGFESAAGGESAPLAQLESAVATIALEWAASSAYASDVLFDACGPEQVDLLVIVRGEQGQALAQHLAARRALAGAPVLELDLPHAPSGLLRTHAALDAEDEAQRAAACVLSLLQQGHHPVALPAIDRQTTRRISAMLLERGITLADETGWRLSTTRAATHIMSLLRAARPLASTDELLDWLKHCAVSPGAVAQWERELRKPNRLRVHVDKSFDAIQIAAAGRTAAESSLDESAEASAHKPLDILLSLREPRAVGTWLAALRSALQMSGQWSALQSDAAGLQVLQALRFGDAPQSAFKTLDVLDAQRMSLAEFMQWVQAALEGASFKVPLPALQDGQEPQVVILPLAQLAGRAFAAAVLAGCDEQRLPLAPEQKGLWSRSQRQALGLPSLDELMQEQQAAWLRAMQVAQVDVLWRSTQGDEVLQPSALLQAWCRPSLLLAHDAAQHDGVETEPTQVAVRHIQSGEDARPEFACQPQALSRPAPQAGALALHTFSASSYADVRTCPYRYFALRLLGLSEAQELDQPLSKREYGAWLHEVLSEFHLARPRESTAAQDAQLLERCAARAALAYDNDAGFVPFAAAWPQVAQSYLHWLAQHEQSGWRFEASELSLRTPAGAEQLQGRLDRVDVLAGSPARSQHVIDYKTENEQALKKRVAEPLEDTQLVFYAALLGSTQADDGQPAAAASTDTATGGKTNEAATSSSATHAAYVSISEKATHTIAQPLIHEALPLFLAGLQSDAQRMAAGHSLPALGEGKACEYCAARGLCRKEMWSAA